MISRDDVRGLVEIFYQSPFKTFFVNSVDGTGFSKPLGIFVSLGLSTSLRVLNDIKDVLGEKYSAVIAEISSKKISGQFLNTLISTTPNQYLLTELDKSILDEVKAKEELARLQNMVDSNEGDLKLILELSPKISMLQDLIDKISDWDSCSIQKDENGNYKIYHKYVNYRKEGDIEYRIGIYVREKN